MSNHSGSPCRAERDIKIPKRNEAHIFAVNVPNGRPFLSNRKASAKRTSAPSAPPTATHKTETNALIQPPVSRFCASHRATLQPPQRPYPNAASLQPAQPPCDVRAENRGAPSPARQKTSPQKPQARIERSSPTNCRQRQNICRRKAKLRNRAKNSQKSKARRKSRPIPY